MGRMGKDKKRWRFCKRELIMFKKIKRKGNEKRIERTEEVKEEDEDCEKGKW